MLFSDLGRDDGHFIWLGVRVQRPDLGEALLPKQELIPTEKPFYSRPQRGCRMALRLSVFVQRFDVPSLNRTHPVNLATNQAKGADSPSAMCSCCRAGCIERCSPRSTEAFESNPAGFVVQTSNPQTSIR